MSANGFVWMHRLPNAVAFRTPVHFATGWGGFQRKSPTGGAAYGTPRNMRMPGFAPAMPSRTPAAMRTSSAARTGDHEQRSAKTDRVSTGRVSGDGFMAGIYREARPRVQRGSGCHAAFLCLKS